MKMLFPDAKFREPTVVTSFDHMPFCESVEIAQGTWRMPSGMVQGDFSIGRLGLKLYRENLGFGYGGTVKISLNGKQLIKVSVYYLANLWPELFKLEVPLLVSKNDVLEVEVSEPAIFVITGIYKADLR